MEGARPRDAICMKSRREAMLQCWRELGEPAVDERVLREIQQRVAAEFGADSVSPAAIARMIADEGGELRHPEVIEADAQWRQSQQEASEFSDVHSLASAAPLTLANAEKLLARLEQLREQHERHDNKEMLANLRAFAQEVRQQAESLAKRTANMSFRAEQAEVAEWLKVWLQTPQLFADWLELRKRSEDFLSQFTVSNHEDTKTQTEESGKSRDQM